LFPFLWGVVAKQGQIFGNQAKGSVAVVTNGMAFSYPGYNEMLTGHPDPRIDRNEFGINPNLTVFEWLNRMSEFRGKVAVYGTWNVFKDIFNEQRSGLVMQAGWDLPGRKNLRRVRHCSTSCTRVRPALMATTFSTPFYRYRCWIM